jgi:hypothetical protein
MIVETADFAFNLVDLVKDPESFDLSGQENYVAPCNFEGI